MNQQLINEIISDKEFLKKICNLNSLEAVQAAFTQKGLNLSIEEIKVLGQMAQYKLHNPEKKSEELLEHVSGGIHSETYKKFKNISVGISSIAVALSAATIAYSTSNNINKLSENINTKINQTGDSWLGRAIGLKS